MATSSSVCGSARPYGTITYPVERQGALGGMMTNCPMDKSETRPVWCCLVFQLIIYVWLPYGEAIRKVAVIYCRVLQYPMSCDRDGQTKKFAFFPAYGIALTQRQIDRAIRFAPSPPAPVFALQKLLLAACFVSPPCYNFYNNTKITRDTKPDLALACILVAMSLSKMRLSSRRRASVARAKYCRVKHWIMVTFSPQSLRQAISIKANFFFVTM